MSDSNVVVALLQNYKPLAAPQPGLRRLLSQYENLPQKSISSSQALHDLSNVLLESPFDFEILSYFSTGMNYKPFSFISYFGLIFYLPGTTVLVDVILEISSRQLGQEEFVQWCALAGAIAERMVHLRGLIEEVISSGPVFNETMCSV